MAQACRASSAGRGAHEMCRGWDGVRLSHGRAVRRPVPPRPIRHGVLDTGVDAVCIVGAAL